MDLHCECGHREHFDGEFFYLYECGGCRKKYVVGEYVKLTPLLEDEITSDMEFQRGF